MKDDNSDEEFEEEEEHLVQLEDKKINNVNSTNLMSFFD